MGIIISILREFFNYWSNDNTKDADISPDVQLQASENETKVFVREPRQEVETDSKTVKNVDIRPILSKLSDPQISDLERLNLLEQWNEQMKRDTETFEKFKDNLDKNESFRREFQDEIKKIVGMILRLAVNAGDYGLTSNDYCNYVTYNTGINENGWMVEMMLFHFRCENILICQCSPNEEIYKLNPNCEVIFSPDGIEIQKTTGH